tara:strand:- start:40071 stop:40691 length:621 start_codon:yes stop_codon:yes gene_type:complete
MKYSDYLRFARLWVARPSRIGAIAPSGKLLAKLIAEEIAPSNGPVLELGAGTGVFTQALLDRGISERDLTLVEFETDFADMLKQRFPQARILSIDATKLRHGLLFEGADVGAVVSGLPVLSMPPRKVISIISGAFGYLRPAGAFYQFTYGPRCPVPRPILDRLGLKATYIGRTVRNLPPASVYKITRRRPLTLNDNMPEVDASQQK